MMRDCIQAPPRTGNVEQELWNRAHFHNAIVLQRCEKRAKALCHRSLVVQAFGPVDRHCFWLVLFTISQPMMNIATPT